MKLNGILGGIIGVIVALVVIEIGNRLTGSKMVGTLLGLAVIGAFFLFSRKSSKSNDDKTTTSDS